MVNMIRKIILIWASSILITLVLAAGRASTADTTVLYQTSCTVIDYTQEIAGDKMGNVFVAWCMQNDSTRRDILLQGADKNGNLLWPEGAISVCSTEGDQDYIHLAADGTGGVFIIWRDSRDTTRPQLYVQRINRQGYPVCKPDGIPICNIGSKSSTVFVYPEDKGIVCFWRDDRNGATNIFTQKIGLDGKPQWSLEGLPVCITSTGVRDFYAIEGNNKWGLAWEDYRDEYMRIYAASVDAQGRSLWKFNGVPVSNVTVTQTYPRIATGAQGDYFFGWVDYRGNDADIYAQRMDSTGNIIWNSGGLTVCNSTNEQDDIAMVEDGWGGFYITWRDCRSFTVMVQWNKEDGFWQRISPDGYAYWTQNGIWSPAISTNQMTPDSKGGFLYSGVNDYHYRFGCWAYPYSTGVFRYDKFFNLISSAGGFMTFDRELPVVLDVETGFYVAERTYDNKILLEHYKTNPTAIPPALWKELE
jgi:hypothetical protein